MELGANRPAAKVGKAGRTSLCRIETRLTHQLGQDAWAVTAYEVPYIATDWLYRSYVGMWVEFGLFDSLDLLIHILGDSSIGLSHQ
jgi:hypothetical protein